MMQSILLAIVGGSVIGGAVAMLMFSVGKICGISGILGETLSVSGYATWRVFFLGGMVAGGMFLQIAMPSVFVLPTGHGTASIIVAGLLVGVGTRLGNGCTSGHGICGLSRFSIRSLVATLAFVVSGMIVATLTEGLFN